MGFLTVMGRLIKKIWLEGRGWLQYCASFLRKYVGVLQH
jgi:hypothetical protein